MIRVAICEDEPNIRSYLTALVRRQEAACEIAAYDSADAYLAAGKEYDLLFLDIELVGRGGRERGCRRLRHFISYGRHRSGKEASRHGFEPTAPHRLRHRT